MDTVPHVNEARRFREELTLARAETAPATATPAPRRWATYAEITRDYGLSRWSLLRLAKRGDLRAAKLGNRVFIDLTSLDSLLERRASAYASGRADSERIRD